MNPAWPPGADGSSSSEPDRTDWLHLAHALLERALRDAGTRGLLIKGPILTSQGLRDPHLSVDVDVLVDPSGHGTLLDRMADLGWTVAVPPTSAQTLPLHSTTIRHRSWPLEIDVHDRFPGFLAGPQSVFEALWAHRTTASIAGRHVPCLDPVAHSLLAALHWLRDPGIAENRRNLAYLVEAVRPRLDEGNRRALADLVEATGSATTAAPYLRALDMAVPGTPHDDSMWRIRTASTGLKTVPWLVELRRTPLRRIPGRLTHALLLTEAEIRDAQPNAAPGAWGLFRARLRRIRGGLRDLPRAALIVWRESRRR